MTTPNSYAYRGGVLHCEDVPLAALAEEVGTPFYCYSAATMRRQFGAFAEAVEPLGGQICYAVKANSNLAIIAFFAKLGAGADVVSEGELRRALAAGVPPERIVFSGVGRTAAELAYAIDTGIGQVNVESERDLTLLSEIAAARGRTVPIAIRVNPDVDARTHAKISTGKAENKFGIDIGRVREVYRQAAALPGVEPVSVALHIGSQLLDLSPFDIAFSKLADLVRVLRADGIGIRHLDLGGGIGVPYRGETPASVTEYATIAGRWTRDLDCKLTFEPGRYLVAEAGVLVSRVLDLKRGATKAFLVQDAAMNDLLRPTLYEAYHPVRPVEEPPPETEPVTADIVGPICETGDFLAKDRRIPFMEAGDLLAIEMAGAYAASMGSTYNTRPLPPEILADGGRWSVIRPRQSYESLIGADRIPDWLAG